MQATFNIHGVSIFGAPLPLSSHIEQDYSYCLPVMLNDVAKVRKQEFIAGRYCAFQAANKIGLTIDSLPVAKTREPIWPEGMTGSISHSKKMAISCISNNSDYLSLGIDAEEFMNPALALEVASTIATQSELDFLAALNAPHTLTILFSAKEALYKALFPMVRKFIDFKEVKIVDLNISEGTFELELISSNPAFVKYLGSYHGSFRVMGETIVTLVSIKKDHYVYS